MADHLGAHQVGTDQAIGDARQLVLGRRGELRRIEGEEHIAHVAEHYDFILGWRRFGGRRLGIGALRTAIDVDPGVRRGVGAGIAAVENAIAIGIAVLRVAD
ncbi:hypothetical protein D9M71_534780 [compost metagenome]